MTDATFDVIPPGICGMNTLAKFLNGLKSAGTIADWHPWRAISASRGASYMVHFADAKDAAIAANQWAAR